MAVELRGQTRAGMSRGCFSQCCCGVRKGVTGRVFTTSRNSFRNPFGPLTKPND